MSSTAHFSKESGGGFTKKKFLGLLLILCLAIGLLTATALAEEVEHPDTAYVKVSSHELTLVDGVPQYFKPKSASNFYPTAGDATNATTIVEYDAETNKVTVTLTGSLAGNDKDSSKLRYPAFVFGNDTNKNFDVDIVVDGACVLSSYRTESIIVSNITGTLTFKDTDKADDQLTLYRTGAGSSSSALRPVFIDAASTNVVIEGATVNGRDVSSYTGGVFNVADFTVKNGSIINLSSYSNASIFSSGNVLIENSSATFAAFKSPLNPVVNVTGAESTITIRNSTVVGGTTSTNNGRNVFSESPVLDFSATNNVYVFAGSTDNPEVTNATETTNAAIDASTINTETTYNAETKYKYFSISPCAHEGTLVDTDKDCTTGLQCPTCGIVLGTVFNATHTGPGQTDCTVEVTCSVDGCEVVLHEATTHTGGTATCIKKAECTKCGKEYGELAAHTPEADDGDCHTAVKCTDCGKTAIEAQEHAYNSGETQCKNVLHDGTTCTHTRKLAYVGLVDHALYLADNEPVYYKVDSDNLPIPATDENDATIILTYNEDLTKVIVELKNGITLCNEGSNYDILTFGKENYNAFAVDIKIDGACTLDSYVGPYLYVAIRSNITGNLTITSNDGEGDSLTIKDRANPATTDSGAVNMTGNLVINNAKVTVQAVSQYYGSAIVVDGAVTITNSDVTLYARAKHAINATGNVLINGSTLTMSNTAGNPLVNVTGAESTITITNSTVTAGAQHNNGTIFSKVPVISPGFIFSGSAASPTVSTVADSLGNITLPDDIELTNEYNENLTIAGTGHYNYFYITPCTHSEKVLQDKDCTKEQLCADCGKEMEGTKQDAHKGDPASLTDCTLGVPCEYDGCKGYVVNKGDHTPGAEDTDCTTPVKCANCNEYTFAAQTHTYTDDADTSCDNTLSDDSTCTHTRKLAYIKLVDQELYLADDEPVYYKVNASNYPVAATDENDATIIITYKKGEGQNKDKVTVRLLNGVTICAKSSTNCFTFGKDGCNDFAVEIVIDGACTLDSTSGYPPLAIESNITGVLTITDTGAADDSLFIQDKANSNGTDFSAVYINGDLVIDDATVTVWNTSQYCGSAIIAKNVTIQNSTVTLYSASKYNISATGNVLVKDSTLTLSSPYSTNSLVNVTDENTITIDNSTVIAGVETSGGSIFSKAPTLKYNGYVFSGSTSKPTVSTESKGDIDASELTPENTYTAGTNYKYFHIAPCTHEPEAEWEDIDQDCTTGLQCPICYAEVGEPEFDTHLSNSSLTDCTLGLHCERDGCTGYAIEPKEDHTWDDELNECNVCHMPRALTPSYIITIPASITTSNSEPVTVTFAARDIENLADGDSIRVSVAGGLDNNGKIKLELQDLELQDNETITILSQMSIDGVIVNNPTPEIVSFATNGDHSEEVPIAFAIPENTQYAGIYTGTITFSVSWVQQGGNAE